MRRRSGQWGRKVTWSIESKKREKTIYHTDVSFVTRVHFLGDGGGGGRRERERERERERGDHFRTKIKNRTQLATARATKIEP